jgi:hypothetical protein
MDAYRKDNASTSTMAKHPPTKPWRPSIHQEEGQHALGSKESAREGTKELIPPVAKHLPGKK